VDGAFAAAARLPELNNVAQDDPRRHRVSRLAAEPGEAESYSMLINYVR
jgi:hypothetical protein